ncbi:MAG: hypothetical protein WC315_01435 [Candidatus Omnitrophota bacterium]|jgi:hypothetical protein
MTKHKIQNKFKAKMLNDKTFVLVFVILILNLFCALNFDICHLAFAQTADDLELILDINSSTIPIPKVFKPNLDLSGRGFNSDNTWPQSLASKEALDAWQKDIGFNGFYRIQYNLWEITQLAKDQAAKDKMLANYENIIKSINDSGGTVILNLFGTPAGMGKILDKNSSPLNLAAYKDLVKGIIKDLSCEKKYNIWYEVWSAPDLEGFFLGRELDYLNLYRLVSESVKELEAQYKIHIPVGAPGASSWFHSIGENNVLTPEKSLVYALIKFCYQNHLNLDFITWHSFSTDPKTEKENTIYDKNALSLVRDWLSYFNFDKNISLIVDEWNYDRHANLIPERKEKAYITASYIPARLKNMYEAGLDNQLYFCLEDFQGNPEGVTRNIGVFYLSLKHSGGQKVSYNVFRMLKELEKNMFSVKLNDEFTGAIATKSDEKIAVLIYNYIDPEIAQSLVAQNIAGFSAAESKFLLGLIRSDQLSKIISQHEEVGTLPTTNRVKNLLKNAKELYAKAEQLKSAKRPLKLNLKNIKGIYSYSQFTLDSSCSLNCEFKPVVEKEITAQDSYQEELSLTPYSVNLIVLKKKPEVKISEAVKTETPKIEASKVEAPKLKEAPKDANTAGK